MGRIVRDFSSKSVGNTTAVALYTTKKISTHCSYPHANIPCMCHTYDGVQIASEVLCDTRERCVQIHNNKDSEPKYLQLWEQGTVSNALLIMAATAHLCYHKQSQVMSNKAS